MKNLILIMIVAFYFVSCNNTTTTKEQNSTKEPETTELQPTILEAGCYTYNENNNTINFEIDSTVNQITGKLTYAYSGKDSNSGKFKGNLEGDKLFGLYTFISEGVESSREVAFMIKDNQLIEGYGDLNETKTAFKDKNTLDYTSSFPLKKSDCSK